MSEQRTNWQTAMRTLSESAIFLFDNQIMSDVMFVFTNMEDNTSTKIYAHSWLLSMLSPVFYTNFKNNFEVSKNIPVSDSSYGSFLELLKFVYTGECNLTNENVCDILKTAKKYSLEYLEDDCINYITGSITKETACLFLDTIILTEDNLLKEKLIEFIGQEISLILTTNAFLNITNKSLELILASNELKPVNEMEIFNGVMKWAEQKCILNNKPINGANKREELGDLIKNIRFCSMTTSELGQCMDQEEGLLTIQEERSLFLKISVNKDNTFGFQNQGRGLENTIEKVIQLNNTDEVPISNKLEDCTLSTSFSVSKSIHLTGLSFATNVPARILHVNVEIYDDEGEILFEEKRAHDSDSVFQLTEPVKICLNRKYILAVKIDCQIECQYECLAQKTFPWSKSIDGIEFRFMALSTLLRSIVFK